MRESPKESMLSWLVMTGQVKVVTEREYDCVRRSVVPDLYSSTWAEERGMRNRGGGVVGGICV